MILLLDGTSDQVKFQESLLYLFYVEIYLSNKVLAFLTRDPTQVAKGRLRQSFFGKSMDFTRFFLISYSGNPLRIPPVIHLGLSFNSLLTIPSWISLDISRDFPRIYLNIPLHLILLLKIPVALSIHISLRIPYGIYPQI